MKLRAINEGRHGDLYVPDNIADWDAPSDWERKRLASMESLLNPGMVLYDIGTEFGWLSAVYGAWCGHENMVLCEPGEPFWTSIRKIWRDNNLKNPLACWKGYVGRDTTEPTNPLMQLEETADVDAPEPDAMAYGVLGRDGHDLVISIDDIALRTRRPPDAITIDVEGAEMEVLIGAFATLNDVRPLVWCSIHEDLMVPFQTTPDELREYMAVSGYHYIDLGTDHEHHALFVPL